MVDVDNIKCFNHVCRMIDILPMLEPELTKQFTPWASPNQTGPFHQTKLF